MKFGFTILDNYLIHTYCELIVRANNDSKLRVWEGDMSSLSIRGVDPQLATVLKEKAKKSQKKVTTNMSWKHCDNMLV